MTNTPTEVRDGGRLSWAQFMPINFLLILKLSDDNWFQIQQHYKSGTILMQILPTRGRVGVDNL